MAKIIDGRKLAQAKELKLAKRVVAFKKKYQISPKLVAIMVGDNPASQLYLRLKKQAAKRIGIVFEKKEFPAETEPEILVSEIKKQNLDKLAHGIMVQMPLPKSLEIRNAHKVGFLRNGKLKIAGAIAPGKDVDCLTPENFGLLAMGKPRFLPATVEAVLEIINFALFQPIDGGLFAGKCLAGSQEFGLKN